MQVKFCLKVVLECWDYISFGITTRFCEILTVPPLLDQIRITLSLIWFLLNFVLFLCDISCGSEPVWVIHYCEWQLATLQPYLLLFLIFFYFYCYTKRFCCTSEKWIVDLFSKAFQNLVKVQQKPNIMLPLLSQLSFPVVCHSYSLKIKKNKQKSVKYWAKTKWNQGWFTSGPIE